MAEKWQYRAMVGAIQMYMQPPEVPFAMWREPGDHQTVISCSEHGEVAKVYDYNGEQHKYSAYQHAKSHAQRFRNRDEIETAEAIERAMYRSPDIMERPKPKTYPQSWTHEKSRGQPTRSSRPERRTALKSSKLVSARRKMREIRSSRKIRQ